MCKSWLGCVSHCRWCQAQPKYVPSQRLSAALPFHASSSAHCLHLPRRPRTGLPAEVVPAPQRVLLLATTIPPEVGGRTKKKANIDSSAATRTDSTANAPSITITEQQRRAHEVILLPTSTLSANTAGGMSKPGSTKDCAAALDCFPFFPPPDRAASPEIRVSPLRIDCKP